MPTVSRTNRRRSRRRQEQEDNIEEEEVDDPSQRSRPEDVEDADMDDAQETTRRVARKAESSARVKKEKAKVKQEKKESASRREGDDADGGFDQVGNTLDIDVENFQDQPILQTDALHISHLASDWEKVLGNIKRSAFRVVQEVAVAMAEAGESQNEEALEELSRMDTVMREFVDVQAELTAHQNTLDDLANEVKLGKNITNIVERYEEGVKLKKDTWQNKTSRQKYGKDDTYLEFKQAIFEVQNPDEAMPPLIETIEREDGDESDDDDIVVGGASQVYTCPLTLMPFRNPVTSTKCHHSFSEAAIQEYLGNDPRGKKCPATGCHQFVTFADFTGDKELERKVHNHLRRERQRQAAADSNDEGTEVL